MQAEYNPQPSQVVSLVTIRALASLIADGVFNHSLLNAFAKLFLMKADDEKFHFPAMFLPFMFHAKGLL